MPPGVRLLTESFSVHSEARFECEPGHKLLDGELTHKCRLDAKWSGRTPICTGNANANANANALTTSIVIITMILNTSICYVISFLYYASYNAIIQ